MRHDDHPLVEPFPDLGAKLGLLVAEKPPRWWFHGLLAVPTIGLLWAATLPGGGGDGAFLVGVVILFFALCWFVRLVAYLVCRRGLAYWFAVAPLAGLLVNAAVGANLPMEARWALAQDDFDRVVREIQAGDRPDVPGRIGTYRVTDVEGVSGGFRFVTHEDFWGLDGFAWFPDGAPSPVTYEHLRGDWYVWGVRGGAD